jgi:hypothetical protein
MRRTAFSLLVFLGLTLFATRAQAQSPPVGVRAAGMGGAFTAVADDGTAPYWNPAGLAAGPFVGVTLDLNSLDRRSATFLGLSTPPLGVSYFRTTSTVPPGSGRNGAVETLAVHHVGATLVQSVGDGGLAVGATIGVVHGNDATAFNADAGVMLAGALGNIGLAVHNLGEPSLNGIPLDRQVRGGVALHLRQDVTVAGDAEFLSVPSPNGKWRDAALGVEAHVHPRAWVRSGVHWNTAGDSGSDPAAKAGAAPVGTAGGSVAVYGSIRADAQVSFGSKNGDRGWGVGLSFIY